MGNLIVSVLDHCLSSCTTGVHNVHMFIISCLTCSNVKEGRKSKERKGRKSKEGRKEEREGWREGGREEGREGWKEGREDISNVLTDIPFVLVLAVAAAAVVTVVLPDKWNKDTITLNRCSDASIGLIPSLRFQVHVLGFELRKKKDLKKKN